LWNAVGSPRKFTANSIHRHCAGTPRGCDPLDPQVSQKPFQTREPHAHCGFRREPRQGRSEGFEGGKRYPRLLFGQYVATRLATAIACGSPRGTSLRQTDLLEQVPTPMRNLSLPDMEFDRSPRIDFRFAIHLLARYRCHIEDSQGAIAGHCQQFAIRPIFAMETQHSKHAPYQRCRRELRGRFHRDRHSKVGEN
jgi:hypothetical protein